jgi:hypothetical protein
MVLIKKRFWFENNFGYGLKKTNVKINLKLLSSLLQPRFGG